jgi:hypothetical protein
MIAREHFRQNVEKRSLIGPDGENATSISAGIGYRPKRVLSKRKEFLNVFEKEFSGGR